MKKFDGISLFYNMIIALFKLNKAEEILDISQLQGFEIVLDLGGGTGKLSESLKNHCEKIYVLDESQGMLSKVKVDSKVVPMLGDALNTGFGDKTMDVVILSDVLHHIKEQHLLMDEIHRILKGDGKLVILDFDRKHFIIKILSMFERLIFGDVTFRAAHEVVDLLKNKFRVEKCMEKKYYYIILGRKDC